MSGLIAVDMGDQALPTGALWALPLFFFCLLVVLPGAVVGALTIRDRRLGIQRFRPPRPKPTLLDWFVVAFTVVAVLGIVWGYFNWHGLDFGPEHS